MWAEDEKKKGNTYKVHKKEEGNYMRGWIYYSPFRWCHWGIEIDEN